MVELVLNEVHDHSFEMLFQLYSMVRMALFFVIEYGTLSGRREIITKSEQQEWTSLP